MAWDETTGIDTVDQELMRRGIAPEKLSFLLRNAGNVQPRDPRLSFVGPRPSVNDVPAPDMAAPAAPESGLSFANRQLAKPAPIMSNPADPTAQGAPKLSFLRPHPNSGPQDREAVRATYEAGADQADMLPLTAAIIRAARGYAGTAGEAQSRPIEDEYRDLLKTEPTRDQFPAEKMSIWKKLAGGAMSILAGAAGGGNVGAGTAQNFFGAPARKAEQQFETAHGDWDRRVSNLLRAAKLRTEDLQDRNLQSEIDARNRPKAEKPENLDREAYDYYVSQGMTPADARKHVLQDAQDVKPGRQTHTSPFEAFAYGDEKERQAAKDFLDMEKRSSARYRNPTEFEEKYRLFKQDPDAYRNMFGDKNREKPDTATATRMLDYFDKRRREVSGDFMLDEEQKRQQLQEIENLERPFLEAVQPGPGKSAAPTDRVNVISPDGRRGHIPRSQLDAAKKKGYREIQ